MSENQAKIVSRACEFYSRVRMGQFEEIIWTLMQESVGEASFCERRDLAKECLLRAREHIYPELRSAGHSYGMGDFEDADTAYDVYMVLRRLFGDTREPFSTSLEPLPKAKRV